LSLITELKRTSIDDGAFNLVWLYTRRQTFLHQVDIDCHPQAEKELFLAYHCECHTPQPISTIKRKVNVLFGADGSPGI